ncbi:hypothetical protein [Sorangium cellulosum]|uniref:Glycosyltransferase RgtA/B/C/D-like domain-containing protein n=1 Tax=Sorangium cellulosum TaxID=56 RepID=A0A150QPT0_SORCE|nr:hypothetical protein [Sorangium cellulosum]KYF69983.1 hypothetical protein BE15_19820 [Sorangium cellulosum]
MRTPESSPPDSDRPPATAEPADDAPGRPAGGADSPAAAAGPRRGSCDRAFVATFALLAVAAIVPIWRVRFLPLLDLPNHLAAVHIWHNFDAPWTRFRDFYELSLRPAPYGAYHILTHVIAHVVSLENANRLVLSGYVLGVPAAALVWARRTRRSPWLSVLTFPLAFSLSWACGFLPFLVGIALLLAGVVALDAHLERPSRGRAAAVALLSVGCGLSHPLILFGYYVCVAVLMLCHLPRWSRIARALPLFAPAVALLLWQLVAFKSPMVDLRSGPRFQGAWVPWHEMIRSFPGYTLDSVSGDLDTRLFWVLLATASLLALWSVASRFFPRPGAEPPPPPGSLLDRLHRHRSLALCAAMAACYFLVPLHLARPFDWWFVSGRFSPLICFFGFLAITAPLRGLSRLLMAPAAVAALVLPLHLSEKYASFDERLEPFTRMVERIPPGAEVLFVSLPPRTDEALIIEGTNHFSSWVQIMRGGFSADGWHNVGFPFTLKRRLPAPPSNRGERFNPDVHGVAYDYVILRNERPDRSVFAAARTPFRRVAREGAFTLYERAR